MAGHIATLILLALAPMAHAAPRVTVLINSAHGARETVEAITILKGPTALGRSVIVDKTVCAPNDTTYDPYFVSDALSTRSPFYSATANGR